MATQDFPGGAYHPELPGGRAGATLRVLWDRVEARVEAESGGATLHIRNANLRMEMGGASGRMLLMRGAPDDPTLFSEAPGLFEAIRDTGGASVRAACEACAGAVAERRSGSRRIWVFALVALALLALLIPPAWRAAADTMVDGLPTSVDTQLGDLVAGQIASVGPAVTAEPVTKLVGAVVDRLAAGLEGEAAQFEFKPVVVENTAVNAFALPGGRIAVCTGLLKRAPSIDALAGVLGHEMTHVTGRHSVRHLVKSVGVVAAFNLLLGDASGLLAMAGEGAAMAILTGYSREQESASDAEGAALLAKQGFDPDGLSAMFKVMKDTVPEANVPPALQWMSTHPALDERIAALDALLPTLTRGPKAELVPTLAAAQAALKD